MWLRLTTLLVLLSAGWPSYALECVPYCQQNGFSDISGDAYEWWDNSQKQGYDRGPVPHVGDVLVWKQWSSSYPGSKGHVAIVAKIVDDDEILVNHANWPADQQIREGVKVKDISDGHWSKVLVQWGSDYGSTPYNTNGFIYQKGTVMPTIERITLYRAGTVGWYPTTDICSDASEWYRLTLKSDGTYKATGSDSGICSEVAPMCYAQ